MDVGRLSLGAGRHACTGKEEARRGRSEPCQPPTSAWADEHFGCNFELIQTLTPVLTSSRKDKIIKSKRNGKRKRKSEGGVESRHGSTKGTSAFQRAPTSRFTSRFQALEFESGFSHSSTRWLSLRSLRRSMEISCRLPTPALRASRGRVDSKPS